MCHRKILEGVTEALRTRERIEVVADVGESRHQIRRQFCAEGNHDVISGERSALDNDSPLLRVDRFDFSAD